MSDEVVSSEDGTTSLPSAGDVLAGSMMVTSDKVDPSFLNGNSECPCLSVDYFATHDTLSEDVLANFAAAIGSSPIDTYGAGCLPHDVDALHCSDINDCASQIPLPPDCDKSFCSRSWCFVDPANCTRNNKPSQVFPGRHYSYATCGELDSFTYTERLRSLRGRTFNVGYASNSGGWKGAYNPSGSFSMNNQWSGPIVSFIQQAALEGGFTINMTQPPEWLRPHSQKFFGNSNFDMCVYATSLGYLDFCVGGFSINEKRSSITTMFETTNDPIYLITHTEGSSETDWESFAKATLTIFQPFTLQAWLMIFLFVLPVLSLLMFYHEFGAPGSVYPREEPVLVERKDRLTGERHRQVVHRPIPIFKHVCSSLYMGTLSFFQGSYDPSIVSSSGKMNLLAIASFIMLILAVYTANLAAILTQDINKPTVDSIEMAVRQGMSICAVRNIANIVIDSYGVDPELFVPDPIALGGDGKPGFDCPDCNVRERIFDQMRRSHNDPSQYCHVTIAGKQDLEILQSNGNHCDKTDVGGSIAYRTSGIPIYDKHADALVSILHKNKADGVMTRNLAAAMPPNNCPTKGGEGSALGIKQLTGVWVITFTYALIALLVRIIYRPAQCGSSKGVRRKERMLRKYDQWGNAPPNDVVVDGYKYDSEGDELLGGGDTSIDDSDENDENDENEDTNNDHRTSGFSWLGVIHEGREVRVDDEEEMTNHHRKSRVSSTARGSKRDQNLEREIQLLHKTMDMLQEQNAEIKRAIASQQTS